MCEEWMPRLQLKLTVQEYQQLPRNPAYKYEYHEDHVVLTPRPVFLHGLFDLKQTLPETSTDGLTIRPMEEADFVLLEPIFASAFHHVQPFGSLPEADYPRAAHVALERTRTGGDGPWIRSA